MDERHLVVELVLLSEKISRVRHDEKELNTITYRILIVDALALAVVASTIHEEAVDEDTLRRALLHLVRLFLFQDLEGEVELINSDLELTSVGLEAASHEALREEEAADPVGGRVATNEPAVEELDTSDQVLEPGCEWLERRIGDLLPVRWDDTVSKAEVHVVERLRHNDETTDGLDKVIKRLPHDVEKPVELLHLL